MRKFSFHFIILVLFISGCAIDNNSITKYGSVVEIPLIKGNIKYTEGERYIFVKPTLVLNDKFHGFLRREVSYEIQNLILKNISDYEIESVTSGKNSILYLENHIKETINKEVFNDKDIVKKVILTEFIVK